MRMRMRTRMRMPGKDQSAIKDINEGLRKEGSKREMRGSRRGYVVV